MDIKYLDLLSVYDKQTDRRKDRQLNKRTDKHTGKPTDIQTVEKKNEQTANRQTHRQINRQTKDSKQIDMQIYKYNQCCAFYELSALQKGRFQGSVATMNINLNTWIQNRQTKRQTNRQKQTNIQTNRQTNRHTKKV